MRSYLQQTFRYNSILHVGKRNRIDEMELKIIWLLKVYAERLFLALGNDLAFFFKFWNGMRFNAYLYNFFFRNGLFLNSIYVNISMFLLFCWHYRFITVIQIQSQILKSPHQTPLYIFKVISLSTFQSLNAQTLCINASTVITYRLVPDHGQIIKY